MTLRLAAGLLVGVALGGCTSSGGGPSSPATSPTQPSSSASSSVSAPGSSGSSAPSAPSGSSLTAIHPIRPLTCADLGGFHRGGSLPSGVPLPQAVPALTCTGSHGAVAVVWTSVAEAQYRQELTGTGWTAAGAVFRKPRAPRTIALDSVHGALVAVFRPS